MILKISERVIEELLKNGNHKKEPNGNSWLWPRVWNILKGKKNSVYLKLEINYLIWRVKSKSLKKMKTALQTYKTTSSIPHTLSESIREKWEKYMWKNDGPKLKNCYFKNSRSSTSPKKDKYEIHTKITHNQTTKSQR